MATASRETGKEIRAPASSSNSGEPNTACPNQFTADNGASPRTASSRYQFHLYHEAMRVDQEHLSSATVLQFSAVENARTDLGYRPLPCAPTRPARRDGQIKHTSCRFYAIETGLWGGPLDALIVRTIITGKIEGRFYDLSSLSMTLG
ncbi:hypothetical protein, partial [Nitratireductor sp.]|uniref:hypothetical protein n=1 Tax=Nitratireductor sp. TaxID=1872084 RepID=UPI002618DFD0